MSETSSSQEQSPKGVWSTRHLVSHTAKAAQEMNRKGEEYLSCSQSKEMPRQCLGKQTMPCVIAGGKKTPTVIALVRLNFFLTPALQCSKPECISRTRYPGALDIFGAINPVQCPISRFQVSWGTETLPILDNWPSHICVMWLLLSNPWLVPGLSRVCTTFLQEPN